MLAAGRVPVGPAAGQRRTGPAGAFQSEAAFNSWGWRIPFLLSAVLVLVGLWIRLADRGVAGVQGRPGPSSSRAAEADAADLEVFTIYPREVFTAMGARMAENVSYYIFTIVIATYLPRTPGSWAARSR